MALFPKIRLATVKARIILILCVGILGMGVLVGVNKYLDIQKNRYIQLQGESQRIRMGILKVIQMEEAFMNQHDASVLEGYSALRSSLNQTISAVHDEARDSRIVSLAEEIVRIEKDNALAFDSVIEVIRGMDRDLEALNQTIGDMNGKIKKMIEAIDYDETMKMMEGDSLEASKAGLRRELKDFLGFGSEKILSILRLLLFSDLEAYQASGSLLTERRDGTVSNIENMIKADEGGEYREGWSGAKQVLNDVDALEEAVLSAWKTNQTLTATLQETGEQVQEKAQKIVDQTRSSMVRGDRTGDLIALVFGAGSILLLLVLGIFVSRSTNRSLRTTISGLTRSSEQVAGASEQVSSSSHSLAEGSSEQAASIEETSSSLEEMSAMTRRNAGKCDSGQLAFVREPGDDKGVLALHEGDGRFHLGCR